MFREEMAVRCVGGKSPIEILCNFARGNTPPGQAGKGFFDPAGQPRGIAWESRRAPVAHPLRRERREIPSVSTYLHPHAAEQRVKSQIDEKQDKTRATYREGSRDGHATPSATASASRT